LWTIDKELRSLNLKTPLDHLGIHTNSKKKEEEEEERSTSSQTEWTYLRLTFSAKPKIIE